MKILVIGAGHVGGAAIAALQARDHEVVNPTRKQPAWVGYPWSRLDRGVVHVIARTPVTADLG